MCGDLETAAGWRSTPLDHRLANLTTRSLERRCGTTPEGHPCSVVVKTLQPASAHPMFAEIPEEFHEEVLQDLDWLGEPRVYRCGLADVVPAPLRMPVVHAISEDSEVSCSIWMEDVADVTGWDLPRYRRTAEALGALAGSWDGVAAEDAFGLGDREIARLFFGKVRNHDLPPLATDAFWADPVVAEVTDPDHRRDLFRLADAVPGMLAAADGGPRGVAHGDATPDNFREPGDGSVVALDWSYGHVGLVGSDLAQLLAGRFESGAAGDGDPEEVAATIVEGYLDGLARAGRPLDADPVRRAFALHLAIRSAFSVLHLDHLGAIDDERRRALLAPRARLGRFALDLALGSR